MWAAGISAGAVPIALWRIVGPGFHRLAAGSAVLIAAASLAFERSALVLVGLTALAAAALLVKHPRTMALAFGAAAVALVVASANAGGDPALSLTGALTLGAVTDEMLLGHWYLVDPRLPRWALKTLDAVAALALTADFALLATGGGLSWESDAFVVGWAFIALSVLGLLLLVGVWFSLGEKGYNGVMAATGLSYLAVLTVIGSTISGRSLLGEGSSLISG